MNQSRLILTFLAGAAAGAAIAYLVTSDRAGDIIEEIKDMAMKVKDNIVDTMSKASEGNKETEEDLHMGV
jgi:hypothetical protein